MSTPERGDGDGSTRGRGGGVGGPGPIALLRVAALSVPELVGYLTTGHYDGDAPLDEALLLAAGDDLLRDDRESRDSRDDRSNRDDRDSRGDQRVRDAIARYVARMGGRATPYGLFAGTALLTGGEGAPRLGAWRDHRARVRIDIRALELAVATTAPDAGRPGLLVPDAEPASVAVAALRRAGRPAAADAITRLADRTGTPAAPGPRLTARLRSEWQAAAAAIPRLAGIPERNRYHVDLELALAGGGLDAGTVAALTGAAGRLEALCPAPDQLAGLRAAFADRYEDAEVPLLAALDPHTGVLAGSAEPASPLAERAGLPRPGPLVPAVTNKVALRALEHWLSTGEPYDLGQTPAAATSARSVQAALLDAHEGRFHAVLMGAQRRSPVALLARFALSRADVHEPLARWLATHHRADEGVIVADLVGTPGGRIGNVLIRPSFGTDRIAPPGDPSGTIGLDRILISLSGGQFVLRDRETGRRIGLEPMSAHAADAPGNDPVYRALLHIADPGSIRWSWGSFDALPHLPRVVCGSVIVAPEQWRTTGAAVAGVLADPTPGAALSRLLPGLGDRRWIGFRQGDRVLPVHLDAPLSVRSALARAAREPAVRFCELPQVESPAVHGPTGRHVGEVSIPLPARGARVRAVRTAAHDPAHGLRWIAQQWFCAPAVADAVVREVCDTGRRLLGAGVADGFFFVRYWAGGHHVRVRVRPAGEHRWPIVEIALREVAARLRAGPVTRITTVEYVPEIVRYGGPGHLRRAEDLFAASSLEVAELLAVAPAELDRLLLAVDRFLSWCVVLGLDLDGQLRFARACRDRLRIAADAPGNPIGKLHRELRADLALPRPAVPAAGDTDRRLAAYHRGLVATHGADEAATIVASAFHLHCNRLFTADARRLEYLTYDFAARRLLELRARTAARPRTGSHR
ncbi:thiopeptide-type bacteriocin biosynthesis protein [Dactylosporangium sp. NPDC000521]|uniref:lantibiotic dehydratase n=1 Tax=Dactylosporangium sp. NPDC000521 TaxID=3363975 RepID=UPI0036AE19FA